MQRAIFVLVIGLFWCGNVNAEEKFVFSSCDAFGFGIGGVVEINLSKKYMKGRFGEGGTFKKVQIKGVEGVYIVSKKFGVKRGIYPYNSIVTANYKYGEITQRYYSGTYFTHQRSAICERVNNELTAHGEARAKAKQAKKPKTVAKKPKEKKPENNKKYLDIVFCQTNEKVKIYDIGAIAGRVWISGYIYPILSDAHCRTDVKFDRLKGMEGYNDFLKFWRAKGITPIMCYEFQRHAIKVENAQDTTLCKGDSAYSYKTILVDSKGFYLEGEDSTQIAKKPKKKKPIKEDDLIIIGSGSGFFVSDQGHIVSNAHVVGVCKKVKAYEEGVEIFLNILATDNVNDIGLVKGKFNNKQYLNIKTDGAELGEQIVAFGYPLSQDLSDSVKLTLGIVSSLSGPDNNYSQIQIDAAIQPGNSGGPVLNMNGLVVGIASAGLSKLYMAAKTAYIPENVNFAVAAHSLTSFLKANKVKVTSGPTRIYSTKELAKIGEPATIQLFCMNTREAYAKLKKANKHSDVLLDLQ